MNAKQIFDELLETPLSTSAPPNTPNQHTSEQRVVYSVSDLNRQVRMLLETQLPLLWIEGEISNFACPRSGHWYLTLKDSNAQVRCAMFKGRNMRVRFNPQDGQQVLVRARAGLYEGRGEFQLIIEHMEEAGLGALQRQFDQLKAKLQAEGLFDEEHKREIPELPKHIGVITSPTGAAIHDILTVLKRRFPGIPVSIFPSAVQGAEATGQIIRAIELANEVTTEHGDCDVLIVGRGGGSLEDLWCFNEEAVARAIFNSDIPVVSAVGHEVDFTIADFVADIRAPTPSAAAELLSPDQWDLRSQFQGFAILLEQALERRLQGLAQKLDYLSSRLRHPREQLQMHRDKLGHLQHRLQQTIQQRLQTHQQQLTLVALKQQQYHPAQKLVLYHDKLNQLSDGLTRNIKRSLQQKQQQFEQQGALLNSVSPLQTLQRGYSITRSEKGEVLTQSAAVKPGERIESELKDGKVVSVVEKVQML